LTKTVGILQVTLNPSGGQSRTRIINADTRNTFPWLTFTDGKPITVLDVFENEPEGHPPLLEMPNVVLTPHIGQATREVPKHAHLLAARNVARVLLGQPPLTPIT